MEINVAKGKNEKKCTHVIQTSNTVILYKHDRRTVLEVEERKKLQALM